MSKLIMLVCLALSLISALIYLLLVWGIMEAGDTMPAEGVPAFFYIIPACYMIGSLLIFLKKRWLWIIGAILNSIPIIVFYAAYAGRPEIMLSAPGLISKVAQVMLEVSLIYLIVNHKRKEVGIA